jgi:hypothetical protein
MFLFDPPQKSQCPSPLRGVPVPRRPRRRPNPPLQRCPGFAGIGIPLHPAIPPSSPLPIPATASPGPEAAHSPQHHAESDGGVNQRVEARRGCSVLPAVKSVFDFSIEFSNYRPARFL